MNTQSQNFQEELKSLLEKYQATIRWSCGESSDLHGIYNEKMIVNNLDNTVLLTVTGSTISSGDIPKRK